MKAFMITTLLATGVLLLVASAWWTASSRRHTGRADGAGPAVDLSTHLARWSALHGDIDPTANSLVERWLAVVHRLAGPLSATRISPNVLSAWGVWIAGLVALTAVIGGRLPLVGALLVLLNGVFDGLDGAVAVLSGRVGRHGRLVDATADRASDCLLLLAVLALGSPWWLVLTTGFFVVALEGTRAVALRRGRMGRVTPGERPTRLILTGVGLLGAGTWPSWGDVAATSVAAATAAIVAASWVLLWLSVRSGRGRSAAR